MKVKEILETMDYGEAPESQDIALEWLKKNNAKFGLFINGNYKSAPRREFFETRNPATGQLLASICQAEQKDVDQAMQSARKAQANWRDIGGISEPNICMHSPDSFKSTPAYLPWSKPSITENRFEKAEMWISHS